MATQQAELAVGTGRVSGPDAGSVQDSAPAPERARRPSGRRKGDSGTRQALLDAAREQFAAKGYAGASLRSIAAAAGVDAALVRHFFGGKDDLFAATLEVPTEALQHLERSFDGPLDDVGRRVVESYLSLWEEPATGVPLLAMFRSAVTDEAAAERLRDFLHSRVLTGLSEHLGPDRPTLRAALASSHMLGVVIARHVIRAEPLASLPREQLVNLLAPTLQGYLTGTLQPTGTDEF